MLAKVRSTPQNTRHSRKIITKRRTLFPANINQVCHGHVQLVEVVLDLGRPPLARFPEGATKLSDKAVAKDDLAYVTGHVSAFGRDNRAGIDGTLHRVSCLRNRDGIIVGITLRVGRAVSGSAELVSDLLSDGRSVLLLGECTGLSD